MEIKISHKPVPYKEAMDFLEKKVEKVHANIEDELGIADANPWGKRPFERKNYVEKFITLTKDFITRTESDRFLEVVQNLRDLKGKQLNQLNIQVFDKLQNIQRKKITIF